MEFPETVAAAVIGGLILAAILTVVAWSRRQQTLDWAKNGQTAIKSRRRKIDRAEHEQLVDWVLQRAETLEVEVAAAVTRASNYVTVTNIIRLGTSSTTSTTSKLTSADRARSLEDKYDTPLAQGIGDRDADDLLDLPILSRGVFSRSVFALLIGTTAEGA